jgi:hypothetical protein
MVQNTGRLTEENELALSICMTGGQSSTAHVHYQPVTDLLSVRLYRHTVPKTHTIHISPYGSHPIPGS